MNEWKFYLETYGCKVNQYESQLLRQEWQKLNGVETTCPQRADYIYINSCAITAKAERDARNAIYRLRRLAPHAKIILCGCAAQFFNDFTPRKHAYYARPDYCLPQARKTLLITDPFLRDPGATSGFDNNKNLESFQRARPIIKIQDGCTQKCAYCIVPQTRMAIKSENPDKILAECKNLLAKGYSELMISGVNLAQYGWPGFGDFWTLLKYLDVNLAPEYAERGRLRISSLEPRMLTDRALETLTTASLVCPHIHLSLQHASMPVLKRMGRSHYTPESILNFIAHLKKSWPIMGIGADILVGFPGETESDLQLLSDFIAEAELTYAHVFPYSRRQGTAAASMPNQLSRKIKDERAHDIRSLVGKQKNLFLAKLLAQKKMTVTADLAQKNYCRGVNEFYAPCFFKASLNGKLSTKLLIAAPIGIYEEGLMVELKENHL